MAEASCSYHSDEDKEISIANIESDEETLPQHDLDTSSSKLIYCKKPDKEESEKHIGVKVSNAPTILTSSSNTGFDRKVLLFIYFKSD